MIVWSGRGSLSLIILIVVYLLLTLVFPKEQSNYALIIGLFVAAGFSWFMGKKWNESNKKTVIDKASGQEIILQPNHSLFWIKMQYWGIIFSVLGIILLIKPYL